MNAASYTAAGTIPAKVIRQADLIYRGGKLRPVHVQISPTNVCQLDCPFCSCANRASNMEMSLPHYLEIMGKFAGYGCKAVTITGGGEPTLHRDINEILTCTHRLGIQAGMVTNGMSLGRVSTEALQALTWARISFSDDRVFGGAFFDSVKDAVSRVDIDWAFSYVVTRNVNYDNITAIIEFANDHEFTHVRLVTDLLDVGRVPDMKSVRWRLKQLGVDDSRVIYQGRKSYAHGRKDCLTSLVKPVISADGGWYPCCGVQYALEKHGLDFEATMCMGRDIDSIVDGQQPFDGSVCSRCYYDDYNEVLGAIVRPVEHEAFV